MVFKLPPSVYDPEQLAMCAEELKSLATAGAAPAPTVSAETQALVAALPAAKQQATELLALARQLEDCAATAPRVTVTLAALASHTLRAELVAWMRTNLGPEVLVAFRANSDIAGGMVVRTTNKVFDLSFRRQLLTNPAEFTEVLRRV